MCLEWVAYFALDDAFWFYTLCSKQLTIALVLSLVFSLAGKIDDKTRAIVVFLCCTAWLDVPLKILWSIWDINSTGIAPLAALIFTWCLWVMFRSYNVESDYVDHDKVMLLFLKPRSFSMTAKSFIGLPFSSVCILAGGYVWSFRTDKKKFTKTKYTDRWLDTHICINTGADVTNEVLYLLARKIGIKRGNGSRCVYTIKEVLNNIGGKFAATSIFHYIPGVYAFKIFGGRNE